MKLATNVPYVKQLDENGKVIDANKSYINEGDNRSVRREENTNKRFFGNGKNVPLTVNKTSRYLRRRQIIIDKKTGQKKTIEHYDLLT